MFSNVPVIFYGARKYYRILPHEDKLIVRICKCIGVSIAPKFSFFVLHGVHTFQCALKAKLSSKGPKRDHWLDYSEEKYGEKFVEDIKLVLRVFFMFIPVPLYWALIEQTATAWVFMARRMNGDLGFYSLSPDQTSLIGSIIYVLLIPILQFVLIPQLNKCGILRTPLQKMTTGGVFVVASFLVAAGVSFAVESTNYTLPKTGEAQLRIYNTLPCDVTVSCPKLNTTTFSIAQLDYYKNINVAIEGNQTLRYTISSACLNISDNFLLYEKNTIGYYFKENQAVFFLDVIEKETLGRPLVR